MIIPKKKDKDVPRKKRWKKYGWWWNEEPGVKTYSPETNISPENQPTVGR